MNSSKLTPSSTQSNDITMHGGVMNIMLGYEDKDAVNVNTGPLVSTLFNSVKTRKLKALISAIVNGKPDEAKKLLDENPSLVLEKLEEKDFVTSLSQHKFNLQPYQAALAVKDMQMAALIKSYFKDANEANRQYDEQRLDEVEDAKKWQPIITQRDKLLDAIRDSKDEDILSSGAPHYIATERKDSPVARELAKFYELLDATLEDVITPGKRPFNPDLYLGALQLYDNDKSYREFFGGSWDHPRALFFVQKVAGYGGLQRYLSVDTIQAHQELLGDTVKKLETNVPQARGTEFRLYRPDGVHEKTVDFYPIRPRGTVGFNFMACASGGGWGQLAVAGAADGPCWERAAVGFRSLCQSKTAAEQNFMPKHPDKRPESTQSSCVMM